MRGRLGALATATCLVAVACGESDNANGTSAATTVTTGGSQSAEADPDGVVRLGYALGSAQTGETNLDPTKAVSVPAPELPLYHFIYGGLLRPTRDDGLVPDLAKSATVIDPSTIEVVLRDGLTLSDGSAFDAALVKKGLEYNLAQDDAASFAEDFFKLTKVEVVDPTTVRLTIADGEAHGWYRYLGSTETVIVPPGTDFEQPVGAGPFRVAEFVPEDKMVLEKNPKYWDADAIEVAAIELVNTPDDQTATAALKAGQVDWVQLREIQSLDAIGSDFKTQTTPNSEALAALSICKSDPPFSNREVRRALSMAIDRESINNAVFGGHGEPAAGIWPASHEFHNPALDGEYTYDPERARELLTQAGYPDGFTFDLVPNPSGSGSEIAQIVQQQLAEIGVTVNITSSANYVEDFYINNTTPVAVAAAAAVGTGPSRLNQWVGDTLANVCRHDDPQLNTAVRELARIDSESPAAVQLWHEIEATVVHDALSVLLVFQPTSIAYDPDRIGDVHMSVLGMVEIRGLYVKA